jgi:hypothetical protein
MVVIPLGRVGPLARDFRATLLSEYKVIYSWLLGKAKQFRWFLVKLAQSCYAMRKGSTMGIVSPADRKLLSKESESDEYSSEKCQSR